MNMTQIKYFLMAAKCKNFTKAADKLFITQPALSRQISSMEAELNVQLFVRNNRSVQLTPAAVVLEEEFEKILNMYNVAVAKAVNSFAGMRGELNIGVLEGTYVGDLFPNVLQYLAEFYPQVKINLRNYSFNNLVEKLYSNELDLIITLKFDVENREKIDYQVIAAGHDYVVVHRNHRLADAKYVKLSDFKDDTFIMVSPDDSEMSPKLIIQACESHGFYPKVKFATSLAEEMLWVEAGVGVCILDSRNILHNNETVRFLQVEGLSDPSLTLAWNTDHYNPMKETFKSVFFEKTES
ncbi:MAG: LysR family transcriptional regulator [Eubacterium sp.]|nr:LysR family transcriptional regulator [Eubacterium sp.]